MNQFLPQLRKGIAGCKLVPAREIPFPAGSASKFIRFSNVRHDSPFDMKIQLFLDDQKEGLKPGIESRRTQY